MFGRKRKQEEENLGLSAPYVSPSVSITPGATPAPAPAPTPTSPAAMPTAVPEMLNQLIGGNGPIGELTAQIKADPEGFREQIMQQAQAAGVSTFVLSPQTMAAQPQHVDVIDELTKAADLHDKGALTDAEFEALKKKLLAES
jgi:Short C-terminal domain